MSNPRGNVEARSLSSVSGSSARALSSKHHRSQAAYQQTITCAYKVLPGPEWAHIAASSAAKDLYLAAALQCCPYA